MYTDWQKRKISKIVNRMDYKKKKIFSGLLPSKFIDAIVKILETLSLALDYLICSNF